MPSPTTFVHLRSRTEYSVSESTLRVDELLDLAAGDGQGAVGVAELDSMFGALRFYNAARTRGIKPILGVDARATRSCSPLAPRLLWIAQSEAGYLRLMRLLSRAQLNPHSELGPCLDWEWLQEEGVDGLACLSGWRDGLAGALAGEPTRAVEAETWARDLEALFSGRFLLEIQRPGAIDDETLVGAVASAAGRLRIPLCATHPMQFAHKEGYVGHELRVCDKKGHILYDHRRPRNFTPHQHFLSLDEMGRLFADLPEALDNAAAVAKSCNLSISLGKSVLPNFPVPAGSTLSQELAELTRQGLATRLAKNRPDIMEREAAAPLYERRLAMELGVIGTMGFDGYFMIVHDFIAWAKSNGIPVGPGRGSGAGSLVAYSLGITDLDPLEYNLLFERFLNPERVSMPDFDIDFCKSKRERVIEYVISKYGHDCVAGIANINTMAARAAIKAAGRALGMRPPFVGSVSSMIPAVPGQDVTIASALRSEVALRDRIDHEPEVKKLLEMAQTLEGLPTAIGQHAAGLVISPTRISDYAPIYLPEGKTQPVTQYDKDDIERAGLVKFDFLGLKTLTEIQLAVDFVKASEGHANFDIAGIPLNDARTYEVFQSGDTHCVFQFESPGMQRLLMEASPTCFGDLVALNALYRPGPMDLIPDFIKRKSGQERVAYMDPRLEPILGETYGIMVYQEQVMQIAQVIGGYTLGGADLLRRAMGKKKVEEMATHRIIFVEGAAGQGVEAAEAGSLFDLMEKFAGYGFNKSHAAAYTLLAYQTAYLKRHHPAAFYAAWLTVEGEEDAALVPALIKDARKHGVAVLPPDINASHEGFTIEPGAQALRYGLASLKGIGAPNARALARKRTEDGPYLSLRELIGRAGNTLNKRVLETLINAGAMDALHPNRSQALAALPEELKFAKNRARHAEKHETIARAPVATKPRARKPASPLPPAWPPTPEQPLLQLLSGERDAFGFYFSRHPYAHFAELLGGLRACESLADIDARPLDWDQHLIAGVVSDCRYIDTKSGKMLIATLGDGDVEIEVKAFSVVAKRVEPWLKKDAFALFAVQLREDRVRGGKSIQVTDAKPEGEARILLAEALHVLLDLDELPELAAAAKTRPGSFPLYAWHPAGENLSRRASPYAFVEQTQECFDSICRLYPERSTLAYLQGKPNGL